MLHDIKDTEYELPGDSDKESFALEEDEVEKTSSAASGEGIEDQFFEEAWEKPNSDSMSDDYSDMSALTPEEGEEPPADEPPLATLAAQEVEATDAGQTPTTARCCLLPVWLLIRETQVVYIIL